MASVTIDLQAAQSPGYRDRGVARYALDFTAAVVGRHPELIEQVALNPSLPPIETDRLPTAVPVTTEPTFGPGQVFHMLSPFELGVPLGELWPRAAAAAGTRLVVTVYDLIPELFPDIYLIDPGQRRRYRARRELIRAADHIVTLSRSAADDVVAHLGVPADRVTIVGAATAAVFSPPDDRQEAQAAAVAVVPGLQLPFVVYNGAVEPRKNMEGLLEAFALLPADLRNEWQLVLVCKMDDGARRHYLTRAEQLGIGGRLLLTGFVPDQDLALLYQAADLAVCPSLYEGYGLPVAEATACGAPAIASNTSSLVELVAPGATFDPHRPDSIAAAIAAALTDAAQRARLEEWSARPTPTWDDVADRAASVYRHEAAAPALRRWRQRPLVALVSPWPPTPTGVAVYNEQLVTALAPYVDVDVYADGDVTDGSLPRPVALPGHDRAIGGYDAVILAIGNSEFHAGALHLLRTWNRPMLVHAHDVRLTNLYYHGVARGAVPEGFAAAVATMYPGAAAPGGCSDDLYMFREVAARATRLWVTSEYAAGLAQLDMDPADEKKVGVWAYAYPHTVDRDDRKVDPLLICSFGVVNAAKSPELLIDAVSRLTTSRPGVRLVFVGPIGEVETQELRQRGDEAGLGGALTFTGRVDDDDYEGWLAQAGVAVQLRVRTNGETSGAVADSLVHGVPTIVSELGPQAALDEVTIRVGADIDAAGLATVLDAVLADPAGAAALGERGRSFAAERGFDRAARQLLELLPELR